MVATRNGMYRILLPHYTTALRRPLPRSAVDAKALGLHITASPCSHAKDKDTRKRYTQQWRSFPGEMKQIGRLFLRRGKGVRQQKGGDDDAGTSN